MTRLRACLATSLGLSAAFAPSAHAIVGGTDVPPGKRGYVAYVSIEPGFACTGTLVTPTVVVTAGHCSSVTGVAVATPLPTDPRLIGVTLGSTKPNDPAGEKPAVEQVIVHPNYNFANGILTPNNTDASFDVALLKLAEPSKQTPVPIAAKSERDLWKPGTLAQIAGFGTTSSGGDAADVMQETEVPIVADATAAARYPDSFEALTQVGAGFPQGGKDTCQGDSGGPLIVPAPSGGLRLVGDTSYGVGCADPNTPGIYGRLADDTLRPFLEANAPGAIAGSSGSRTGGRSISGPAPGATTLGFAVAADRRRLGQALARGIRLRARTTAAADVVATLRLGERIVARGTLRGLDGRRTATMRFTPGGRRVLANRRRATLTLSAVAIAADGQRLTATQRLALRR